MHSRKVKWASLCLACAMALGFAGCAMSAPATVGTIGGAEIPAGIYLLAQYNAFTTASSLAELAEGESSKDVKAVLKAQCTGTIGTEEVTASGEEYISRLTTRSLEYYAAVEKTFAELGGVLDEAAVTEAQETAESLWATNGDLYTANGIGKASVELYLCNAQKARAILQMLYGEEGSQPVAEADYKAFISEECYYIESVQLPLVDYGTYSLATDEQKEEISALADACVSDLSGSGDEAASGSIYMAAMTYVPQALAALGSTADSSQAVYYASEQLYTPDELASFASGDINDLTDPLDAVAMGEWVKIDLGTYFLVARRVDPLENHEVSALVSQYNLLDAMKSGELQDTLYADGAALEHALDQSAVKTYSPSKIKTNV
ncbi:MAG: hypothetical protein ACI4OI_01845 [Gemmiger sp.]